MGFDTMLSDILIICKIAALHVVVVCGSLCKMILVPTGALLGKNAQAGGATEPLQSQVFDLLWFYSVIKKM